MWKKVHIYSIKTKSQAGNTWVKDRMTTQKTKANRTLAKNLKNLRILSENLAEGLGSRRERSWDYVFTYKNTL